MRICLFFLFTLFLSVNTWAAELESDAYNDFEGVIDSSPIFLSIYASKDGTIQGHYFYREYEKKIELTGSYSANIVNLNELDDEGNVRAVFSGVLSTDSRDWFIGTWKNLPSNKEQPFKLSLASIIPTINSDLRSRYDAMGVGNDQEIEEFATSARNAILEQNYKWLSEHINYPIAVFLNSKEKVINNSSEFIRVAPKVFSEEYLRKIKSARTKDLFANWQGAMIGDGEIWICYCSKEGEEVSLKIIAINPVINQ